MPGVSRMMRFLKPLLALGTTLLCCCRVGADGSGPRDLLSSYFDALKAKDYPEAMRIAEIHPLYGKADELMQRLKAISSGQNDLQWSLVDYKITQEKLDGGLAQFTVEETDRRFLNPQHRSGLTKNYLTLAEDLQWGQFKLTSNYVLLKLDGKWIIDAARCSFNEIEITPAQYSLFYRGEVPAKAETLKGLANFLNRLPLGRAVIACDADLGLGYGAFAFSNFVSKGQPR